MCIRDRMSFSAAAQELYITQSAVSHQIRNLEDFLGKKLFIRQGKLLSLTPAGSGYFPVVRRVFSSLNNASAKTMGQSSGTTRVAVYSSFAVKWLIPRLPEFRQEHPEIDLRITMISELKLDLDLLSVDCAISTNQDNPDYHYQFLRSEEWFPVCSPELYQQLKDLSLQEIFSHFPLLEGEYQNEWHHLINKMQLTLPHPPTLHYFSHVIFLQQAAIESQGIACLLYTSPSPRDA